MFVDENSRPMARAGLFCSVSVAAFIGLGTSGALAQTAPATPAPVQPQAAAPVATDSVKNPEAIAPEIIVTGSRGVPGGLMKVQTAATAMQSITPAAIQEKLTVASPLQIAATIPGVNFGSSDAYGLSIRNFLSIRGMDQTEIGFMVENAPGINLLNYFPYTETWTDNENISDITVTPGNSRLYDPIINASGGEFILSVRDPRDTFGGMVSGSVGSYDGRRGFVDIDTGEIGNSGAKAFLSYSHTRAGNYVGPGTNRRDHVDFKITKEWTPGIHSSLFVSYNNWSNARINILNLAQAKNGIATNLDQYQYASTYVPGVTTNYYKLAISPRRNWLVVSNNTIDLTDRVRLYVNPYFKTYNTQAGGQSSLNPAATYAGTQLVTPAYDPSSLVNGRIPVLANIVGKENGAGVNTYLEADLTPQNRLQVGFWHDESNIEQYQQYQVLNQAGDPSRSPLYSTGGALITGINFKADVITNQVYIGDTQSLFDDKLKISLGFKNIFYTVRGVNRTLGLSPNFNVSWSRPMPRILISYEINPSMQVYGNVTTNARMPNVFATYVTYTGGTGAIAQVGNTAVKPEYTTSAQIGYRYHGAINVDINAFYMHLKNHQVTTGTLINGNLSPQAISIGGEKVRGVSLEVSTRSYHGFSVYGNVQYQRGTFDDNFPINGDFLPTRGNEMVETPNWVANAGARFESGGFFASATAKYVSSQYTTFMNNQTMPSYLLGDLSIGYNLPSLGPIKEPVIRLNVTNLGNKPYISSGSSVVPTAVATRGINGTLIPAGTPLYYVGAPRSVLLTVSTKF